MAFPWRPLADSVDTEDSRQIRPACTDFEPRRTNGTSAGQIEHTVDVQKLITATVDRGSESICMW